MALPAANAVYVVQDGSLQQVVHVGIEPVDLEVDLAGGALFVASYVSGDVAMVTPGSWQVETTVLAEAPTSVTVGLGGATAVCRQRGAGRG